MFNKLKRFWRIFLYALKSTYNKEIPEPLDKEAQSWQDLTKVNLLQIFVNKLNNLTNIEASFDIETDNNYLDKLQNLCKDIENNRFDIVSFMLADGDYFIFPSTNQKGEIFHSYLTQQQVRIINIENQEISEAYGIINWFTDKKNKTYYLLRHHKLDIDGTLYIYYSIKNDQLKEDSLPQWEHLRNKVYKFVNANHIGFGRYKSPTSSRGLSPIYGVPLNFGCGDIEKDIFNDLELINDEFKNGKSLVFTDLRNVIKNPITQAYEFARNIISVQSRAGQTTPNIEIYNPELRFTPHHEKLIADMERYEQHVGTSKGILTENQTSYTATATAVKRSNADTLALIDKIRNSIDTGNIMTLKADSVFLNIPFDTWQYKADWFDPFEDPAEQWTRLIEAKNNGAAETIDLMKWIFPSLSDEAIIEKLNNIKIDMQTNTDEAIERILSGR